jgi:hypothetical protein
MALQSMTALASITLQEASASVSFSGIPQNYRDLVLIGRPASSSGTVVISLKVNSDSGNNYHQVVMFGTGSTTGSFANSPAAYLNFLDVDTNANGIGMVQIIDYSATNKQKTILLRRNQFDAVAAVAARWANTEAITSVQFDTLSGSLAAGSTFNLYGRIA